MYFKEKAMATHSSTLAWKIPWMEEPGRLQSMGLQRVGHDWVTSLSRIGEGKGNPLQCSCLENPRDRGAWWVAIYRVAQSWTRLKWLSSSSSSMYLKKKSFKINLCAHLGTICTISLACHLHEPPFLPGSFLLYDIFLKWKLGNCIVGGW